VWRASSSANISGRTVSGARGGNSTDHEEPRGVSWSSMKPEPPIEASLGSTTVATKAMHTAASTAFPPSSNARSPASTVSRRAATAMHSTADTDVRPIVWRDHENLEAIAGPCVGSAGVASRRSVSCRPRRVNTSRRNGCDSEAGARGRDGLRRAPASDTEQVFRKQPL
jgi:hypothetical protein